MSSKLSFNCLSYICALAGRRSPRMQEVVGSNPIGAKFVLSSHFLRTCYLRICHLRTSICAHSSCAHCNLRTPISNCAQVNKYYVITSNLNETYWMYNTYCMHKALYSVIIKNQYLNEWSMIMFCTWFGDWIPSGRITVCNDYQGTNQIRVEWMKLTTATKL